MARACTHAWHVWARCHTKRDIVGGEPAAREMDSRCIARLDARDPRILTSVLREKALVCFLTRRISLDPRFYVSNVSNEKAIGRSTYECSYFFGGLIILQASLYAILVSLILSSRYICVKFLEYIFCLWNHKLIIWINHHIQISIKWKLCNDCWMSYHRFY